MSEHSPKNVVFKIFIFISVYFDFFVKFRFSLLFHNLLHFSCQHNSGFFHCREWWLHSTNHYFILCICTTSLFSHALQPFHTAFIILLTMSRLKTKQASKVLSPQGLRRGCFDPAGHRWQVHFNRNSGFFLPLSLIFRSNSLPTHIQKHNITLSSCLRLCAGVCVCGKRLLCRWRIKGCSNWSPASAFWFTIAPWP